MAALTEKLRGWWRERRLVVMGNAWGLALGLASVFAALSYFADPESFKQGGGSLIATLEGWAYVWNALYLLGGLGMVYGIVARNRAVDMAGLVILASALTINALCILLVQGGLAGSTVPTLLAFAVAALARVRALYLLGKL